MRTRNILLLCLTLITGSLAAQTTVADKKFKCTATSFTDLVSNTVVSKSTVFIIDGPSKTVEWQQRTVTSQMQISSSIDEWTSTPNGRLLLNIVWKGKAGTVEVKKTNGSIIITMDVNPSGKDRLYFKFEVSSLQII